MPRKFIDLCISWLIGLVLTWSAFAHLGNHYTFLDTVMQYGLLPGLFARLVAAFAPWFQLVLAFCLLSGVSGVGVTAGEKNRESSR
jgi:hypothetical protein